MGIAAGTCTQAAKLFEGIGGLVNGIPSEYGDNYSKKYANAKQMATTSTEKAKNVFFEKIPPHSEIPIPDTKNFVKFDESCKEPLTHIPILNETLRHVIPPEVRSMQNELKQFI